PVRSGTRPSTAVVTCSSRLPIADAPVSLHRERVNREHFCAVGPGLPHPPTRAACKRGEAIDAVLVAVLGMNAFTWTEGEARSQQAHRLLFPADQVHLDAVAIPVIDRPMSEGGQVEIAAKLTVDANQHIEVESRGNPGRVVIGIMKQALVLLQVGADDHL